MILHAKDICLRYGNKEVVKNVSITVNKGEVVSIVGPNGCGKSTILKALSRYIKPSKGEILLEGKNIQTIPTKKAARKIAILPQVRNVPNDFTVETLVSYGRYPHLSFGNRLKKEDVETIDWAINKTGMNQLRERTVATLSGGEQQRAWIAMALAQRPEILILDEPTTFLDISYQLEILELVKELNKALSLTIIMVLHDINQAIRYSHRIYVIKNGEVYSHGDSKTLISSDLLRRVFRIEADALEDSTNGCPYYIPQKMVIG
ncbi:ABC transporter ATP-binding protein [Alkaliphilus pronyensis]|uniref:ABC transporter ATP-binding protein n=1 Tax=Alkaliphilus pronyensis TaxID=1482732 RepID=A0A6I0F8K2_9FIRM|nr:ABC transporter ATP-binding protein [Alkaliphilus pronyensis]KAB3539050.1 ABC transporter ATP-binding protein [Alkaliphilus pronyensis]